MALIRLEFSDVSCAFANLFLRVCVCFCSPVIHGVVAELVPLLEDCAFPDFPILGITWVARIDQERPHESEFIQYGDRFLDVGDMGIVETEAEGGFFPLEPLTYPNVHGRTPLDVEFGSFTRCSVRIYLSLESWATCLLAGFEEGMT
jgi:hypothetical protein